MLDITVKFLFVLKVGYLSSIAVASAGHRKLCVTLVCIINCFSGTVTYNCHHILKVFVWKVKAATE
jgi:hypothetical protein